MSVPLRNFQRNFRNSSKYGQVKYEMLEELQKMERDSILFRREVGLFCNGCWTILPEYEIFEFLIPVEFYSVDETPKRASFRKFKTPLTDQFKNLKELEEEILQMRQEYHDKYTICECPQFFDCEDYLNVEWDANGCCVLKYKMYYALVAQLVEQFPFKELVSSSSLDEGTY